MTTSFLLLPFRKRLFRNSIQNTSFESKSAYEEEDGEFKKSTNNHDRGYLLLLFMIVFLMLVSFLLFTFRHEIKVEVIRNLGVLRQCSSFSSTTTPSLRIAIVSIALQQKQRNEDETGEKEEEEIGFSFAEEVIENKRSYAARHGYAFFLENELDPTFLEIEFEATNRISSIDSSPSLKVSMHLQTTFPSSLPSSLLPPFTDLSPLRKNQRKSLFSVV
jgi:hypothetical protein